jgi:predicted nucleic acid-binding protein
MRRALIGLLIGLAAVPLAVAQAGPLGAFSAVSFRMEPRDPQAPPYEFRIAASGEGTYRSEAGGANGSQDAPVVSQVHVSPAVLARIAQGMARVRSGKCESSVKNIAQTGRKTFALEGDAAPASCTFNFSDDSKLMSAVDAFEALAETLRIGARLTYDHRFDRLGLDADMDRLVSEVGEGRALEPGNIAPVLQSVAEDDRVIDRVRREAQRLLTQSAEASASRSSAQ